MRGTSWLVPLCACAGLLPAPAQEQAPPPRPVEVAGEVKADGRYTGVRFPGEARWLTWAIEVPPDAAGLLVIVRAQADVDLFLRHALPIADYERDPDHRSVGASGDEVLLIDASSRPPLRPGRYFLDLLRPEGVEVPPFELMVAMRNIPALAYARRGRQARLQGDLRGAARDLERALQLDPREDDAWAERAQLRATLGDRPGAAADFAHALELAPERLRGVAEVAASGSFSLALQPLVRQRALLRIQVPAGCGRLHVRASDAGADVDLYLREGLPPDEPRRDVDHQRTTWRRDEALWLEPADVPRPLAPGTWWLAIEASPARTVGTLQVAVQLDPPGDPARDARWWADRAAMHAHAGQAEAALRALTVARKLEPGDPHLQFARAEALRGLQRWREAEAAYDQVLALDAGFPGGGGVLLGRAICRREAGNLDGALRDLEQLAVVVPRSAEVPHQRAQVHLRRGERAQALLELDRALELDPTGWQALLLRAQVRAREGQREEGIRDHDLAMRLAAPRVLAAEEVELVIDEPRTLRPSFPQGRKRRVYLLLLPPDVYTLTLDLRGADWLQVRARAGLPPEDQQLDYATVGQGDKRVVLSRDSEPPLRPGAWYVELGREGTTSALEPELSVRWTTR